MATQTITLKSCPNCNDHQIELQAPGLTSASCLSQGGTRIRLSEIRSRRLWTAFIASRHECECNCGKVRHWTEGEPEEDPVFAESEDEIRTYLPEEMQSNGWASNVYISHVHPATEKEIKGWVEGKLTAENVWLSDPSVSWLVDDKNGGWLDLYDIDLAVLVEILRGKRQGFTWGFWSPEEHVGVEK